ncbi:type II toxin-antitoxin system RelE/ParE family toxin [Caulobacter sp. FWC2]|uniref:type II toxin-antitoxin system RelE/ParE family toxin n=1 Tax=Caulobacter sp. FWC2 TaxID=69664 RepID=UPI000C152F3D|nr:type II toxin-antitoxin system RelE/ParE family toxin [Caulobacter sp. FWC2]PIB90767.1 plasmid stabilization protein ParE [Caulobacter sp. FWC2]
MAQVIWTDRALADIEAIVAYISSQSRPIAAQRLGSRLFASGESLADHPERGRLSTRGRREIAAIPPYVLRYRVVGDMVVIGSVRHGARRPI